MSTWWDRLRCRTWRSWVSRGLDGYLQPGEGAELSAHLVGCAPCRGYAQRLEEDAQRLETHLAPLSRPAWAAGTVSLSAPEASLLPSWVNVRSVAFLLLAGVLASLTMASGPYALCFGALYGVSPSPEDVSVGIFLVCALFGGLLLLGFRQALEQRLLRVSLAASGAAFLLFSAVLLGSYHRVTCAVWGI